MACMNKDDVTTKEDLIKYLDSIPDGLPFLEELWERCIEKSEEDKTKERPVKEVMVKNKHGEVTVKKQPAGVVIVDPVKWYFKLMNLPQYKKKALNLMQCHDDMSDSRKEFMEAYFDEEESQEYDDIAAWINLFSNHQEKQYLKQRLSHYYDNYDINDGADRTILSGILSVEIELFRINIRRAEGKAVDVNREQKLRKMLMDYMEAQKWTKKQRSATDEMSQNKFTIWMEKQSKNGKFTPEIIEYPKDEIDMLIEIIPKAIVKMFD